MAIKWSVYVQLASTRSSNIIILHHLLRANSKFGQFSFRLECAAFVSARKTFQLRTTDHRNRDRLETLKWLIVIFNGETNVTYPFLLGYCVMKNFVLETSMRNSMIILALVFNWKWLLKMITRNDLAVKWMPLSRNNYY